MRVLMLTTNSSLMDGINRHILAISKGIASLDVEVAVCIVEPYGDLACELEKRGIKAYSLGCSTGHSIKLIPRFLRVMHEFNPDVVHIHVLAIFERVLLSALFPRIKKVQTIHGICDPVLRKTLRMRIEGLISWLFPVKTDNRIFISNGVRQVTDDELSGDVTIYNPIEFCAHQSRDWLRASLGIAPDAKVIGTACRMAQVKNPQSFTRIMCEVTKRVPNAHAIVIGDGDETLMGELRTIAANDNNVHFLGYRKDADRLLAGCDVFVMTSSREGMPTSMLEALSCGVPIAFWEGEGGLGDLARMNETEGPFAVVKGQGDEKGLADAIVELLRMDCAVMRVKGRAIAVKNFSLSVISHRLVQVYRG